MATPQEFFQRFMPHAQRVAQRTGVDPRIVLAQAALETGYGRSAPGNNFFGIKSHGRGGGQSLLTQEFEGGQMVTKPQSFRGYQDPSQSFDDYGAFLQANPRYREMLSASSLEDQVAALGRSGYATDPEYANKIRSIVNRITPDAMSMQAAPARAAQGGQQMAEQPQGLLGRARQPGGILSDTGFLSPDRRDRLILALEGMTLNPNQGLQQAALSGIQERSQQRATTQQRNQTAEWLRQRGREDLAAGVESGAIPAQAAVETALAPAADDRTALQKNYEFFLSQGMTPEQAMGAVKSGTTVNVQGQPQVGTIPQGYQLTQDKESGAYRMEAIPGGPADIEAQAAAQADVNRAQQQEVKGSVINDQIDQALSLMEKKGALDILPEAGILGGALGAMGINQDAVDLQNTLASIQSAVAFDTLQKMREASKTGGALGAVSERELDLLISAYGALQQSSSPDLLRKNLQTVREIMGKIESDPVAGAFYQSDGQRSAPAASNNGGFTVKRTF